MHNNKAQHIGRGVAVVIVAGGAGKRAGGEIPKQFQELGGRTVLDWSVFACGRAPEVGSTVVVAPSGVLGDLSERYSGVSGVSVVAGGETRTASVRAGLEALRNDPPGAVLIHDAARPGLNGEVIVRLLGALAEADAVAPALPVVDALKRSSGDDLSEVDRDGVFRVQTPQAFRYEALVDAYRSTDASAVDDLAMLPPDARIKLIEGDPRLMKVTYPGDMEEVAKHLCQPDVRSGTGFDVHAFGQGDHVVLCGHRIDHDHALAGHSDADVGWHALTDALLGALALGDIGDHFPPSDPKWKGASSETFLAHAVKLASERNYRISNADVTLICEAPRIGPHRAAMRARTAEVLGIAPERVSIKATTTEELGFTGRREGIAAQASVTLIGWMADV